LKTFRAYLKHYPKWQYYDLSLDWQRELILNNIKEDALNGLEDDEIDEYIPYERKFQSTGPDESKRFGEMIDWEQVKTNKKGESVYIGGRFSKEDSSWMRKKRNPDKKIRAKIFWYVDFEGRENLKNLIDDLENKIPTDNSSSKYPKGKEQEWFWSADFAVDYSKYDVEPDVVVTENTKESKFYQNIFELIREDKLSYLQIAEEVSNPKKNLTISDSQIGRMKELIKV
jgi:hypothetical protein